MNSTEILKTTATKTILFEKYQSKYPYIQYYKENENLFINIDDSGYQKYENNTFIKYYEEIK